MTQAQQDKIRKLLAEAEVVTIHLPLDGSTRDMFDARRLHMMRRGACLINLSRGGIVDEATLGALLRSGHLAGAAALRSISTWTGPN